MKIKMVWYGQEITYNTLIRGDKKISAHFAKGLDK